MGLKGMNSWRVFNASTTGNTRGYASTSGSDGSCARAARWLCSLRIDWNWSTDFDRYDTSRLKQVTIAGVVLGSISVLFCLIFLGLYGSILLVGLMFGFSFPATCGLLLGCILFANAYLQRRVLVGLEKMTAVMTATPHIPLTAVHIQQRDMLDSSFSTPIR